MYTQDLSKGLLSNIYAWDCNIPIRGVSGIGNAEINLHLQNRSFRKSYIQPALMFSAEVI